MQVTLTLPQKVESPAIRRIYSSTVGGYLTGVCANGNHIVNIKPLYWCF